MELEKLFGELKNSSLSFHSDMGTRDESKQTRNYGQRISKLGIKCGIDAQALIPKDISLPFNPMTCEPDDNYNTKSPFRPIMLVSSVIELIRMACKDNEEVAAKWTELLGVDIITSSNTEVYNKLKALGYIHPRIMSYYTVACSFGGVNGLPDYKVNYTVDESKLNSEGTYDYVGAPPHHLAAVCFNSLLKPEVDAVVKSLKAVNATKEVISARKRDIYAKSPVKFVSPSNLVAFLYFPLDKNISDIKVEADSDDSVIRLFSFMTVTDKIVPVLQEIMSKPMLDDSIDWFDITIHTPQSGEQSANGSVYNDDQALTVYQGMTVRPTDGRYAIFSAKGNDGKPLLDSYRPILKAVEDYFIRNQSYTGDDASKTFEAIMARSNKFRPIESIMDVFAEACNAVFCSQFANSPYANDEFRKRNKDFLIYMNPDNAIALASADDDELEEAAKENASEANNLLKELEAVSESDLADELNEPVIEDSDDDSLSLE